MSEDPSPAARRFGPPPPAAAERAGRPQTIGWVCELTPPGRGAVASLRWEGSLERLDEPPPLARLRGGAPLRSLPLQRVRLADWGAAPSEEVVLARVDERTLEIHCHGGRAAAARIVADLLSRGGRQESPDELLDRTLPLVAAEFERGLSRCTTARTAALMLQHAGARLQAELTAIRDLSNRDLSDRDLSNRDTQVARVDAILRWDRWALHLTEPWSVAICGRPNVGKSSLLNALVGHARAIVSPQPGTTRDIVAADIVLDGWPIELADTAGLREAVSAIESAGIARARARLASADLVIVVLDRSLPLEPADRDLLAAVPEALVVAHKSDLPAAWTIEASGTKARCVSSLTGAGLEELAADITTRLLPDLPPPDAACCPTPRVSALLRRLRQTLSTTPALTADDWRELLDVPAAGG